MITAGGTVIDAPRQAVYLYIYSEGVDALYAEICERVEVVEEPYDTFYGMHEFIIRDPNGY